MTDDSTAQAATDAPDNQPDPVGDALKALDAELLSEQGAPYVSARAAALISAVVHAIAGR